VAAAVAEAHEPRFRLLCERRGADATTVRVLHERSATPEEMRAMAPAFACPRCGAEWGGDLRIVGPGGVDLRAAAPERAEEEAGKPQRPRRRDAKQGGLF
jgi:hypothetical protein